MPFLHHSEVGHMPPRKMRFKARQAGRDVSKCLPAPKSPQNALQTRCILPAACLPDPDLTHRALFHSRTPVQPTPHLTLP